MDKETFDEACLINSKIKAITTGLNILNVSEDHSRMALGRGFTNADGRTVNCITDTVELTEKAQVIFDKAVSDIIECMDAERASLQQQFDEL